MRFQWLVQRRQACRSELERDEIVFPTFADKDENWTERAFLIKTSPCVRYVLSMGTDGAQIFALDQVWLSVARAFLSLVHVA
jgi:hypothetical protein